MNEIQETCTGYPLAIGSVRGVRSFRVDKLGRLTGVTYLQPWTPGENVAQCLRERVVPEEEWTDEEREQVRARDPFHAVSLTFAGRPSVTRPDPCNGQDPECECGFYAYHDGISDYRPASGTYVDAVVEGYGKTTVGTRGFRAGKARILAIAIPAPRATKPGKARQTTPAEPAAWDQAKTDRYGHWLRVAAVNALCLAAILMLGAGIWWALLAAVPGAGLGWVGWHLNDIRRARRAAERGRCRYPTLHNPGTYAVGRCGCSSRMRRAIRATTNPLAAYLPVATGTTWASGGNVFSPGSMPVLWDPSETRHPPVTDELAAKIRRNYPDVPVFDSYEAMVAAFPPDRQAEPNPSNDPDFWTRRVR